ncbi:MAG: FAD-binding protein [Actinobacteria bacterium]|nr:FAD-binding protein [Actinomycetota bacterium]
MDLIHPTSKRDVVDAVRDANAGAQRLLAIGGRRHADKGNPCEIDAELWTTQLNDVVAYEPAEMLAVVGSGMRVGALNEALAGGGQEWMSDLPQDATVGGVIASAASSPRRLKLGAVRDTVVEAELVTGDGRFVRSGARTVKNVTGYDLHRLVAGSLGTLAVIVQVAIKVRPLPKARRTLRFDGGLELARSMLGAVPGAACVLATARGVELRLEGWAEEVEEQSASAGTLARPVEALDDGPFPSEAPWDAMPVVAEVAVPPSRLGDVVTGETWGALAGVGISWVGLEGADGALSAVRDRARSAGGIAPVVRGPGGLGDAAVPAPEVHRRLKAAFDPNGVLAPGRFWGRS